MKRALVIVLCSLLIVPASVAAAPVDETGVPPVAAGVVPSRGAGPIARSVQRETARLLMEANVSRAARGQATSTPPASGNWISRHPVAFGTLAGAGVGLGFGIAAGSSECKPGRDSGCSTQSVAYVMGPIMGAAIGAGIGLVFKLVR
jgi:hypothetical protein